MEVILQQPKVLSAAYQSLDAVWESWFTLEDRIFKGRAYVAAHPHDAPARSLLARLEAQAVEARERWEMANVTYSALCGEKEKVCNPTMNSCGLKP